MYIIPSPMSIVTKPTIFNIFVVSFVSLVLNVFLAIVLASYIIITDIATIMVPNNITTIFFILSHVPFLTPKNDWKRIKFGL